MAINRDVSVNVNLVVNSKTVTAGIKSTESQFKSFFKNISTLAAGFGLGNLMTNAFQGIRNSISQTINEVVKFDQTLKSIEKTTGLSVREVENLSKAFLELSTRVPISAQQLAEVAVEAGRLGISGEKSLIGFAENVSKVAVALDMSASEAATSMAQLSNAMGLGTQLKETPEILLNIASAINTLDDSAATSASRIVESLQRVGPVARNFGKTSVDQLAALSTVLLEQGISAEETGTAIRNSFLFASTKVDKFAKVMGVSIQEASAMLEEDGIGTLVKFAQAAKDTGGSVDAANAITEIFGTRAQTVISVLANSTARLTELQLKANESFKAGQSVLVEYERQAQGADAVLALLRNQITTAALEMGLKFVPFVKAGAQALTEFFQNAREVGVLDAIAKAVSGIDPAIKSLVSTIATLGTSFLIIKNAKTIFTTLINEVSTFSLSLTSSFLKAKASVSSFVNDLKTTLPSAFRALKSFSLSNVITSLKAFRVNLNWALAAQPGLTFTAKMKLAMTQFTLSLKQGIVGFDTFKLSILTGFKSLQIGAKIWSATMKVAMAGATLGLSIVMDVLITYAYEFVEAMGGWGNTFTFITNKMKEFGTAIGAYVLDKLAFVFEALSKLPVVGSKFKDIAAGLASATEKMQVAELNAIADNAQLKKKVSGETNDQLVNDDLYMNQQRLMQSIAADAKISNVKIDTGKATNSKLTEDQIKAQEEAHKKMLEAYEKQLRSQMGLIKTAEMEKQEIIEKLQQEQLQRTSDMYARQLDTEFGLVLTHEQKLEQAKLKIRLEKMEEARQQAFKDAEDIAAFTKNSLVDIFKGGQFSLFNQMAADPKKGMAGAIAGATGAAFGALGQGAQGGANLVKDLAKNAAMAAGPIGAAAGPLIDLLAQPAEQLREQLRGFINAIPEVIEQIITNLPILIAELADQIPIVIDRLAERAPIIIERLVLGLAQNAGKIAASLATALAGRAGFIAVSFATEMVKQAPRIVTEIVKGLANGVKDVFKNLNPFGGGGGGIFGSIGKIFKFAEGGVVPGTSYVGDNINARVNSGERILTARQNRAFETLVNSATNAGSASGSQSNVPVGPAIGTVNIVINGAGVSDEKKLADMIIDKLRTESQRGRKIIQASGIGV